MRAMRLLGEGQAIVTDRPEPRPGPGQVLLKMKAAAICGSDLHRYKLKLSDDDPTKRFVPGHEPCGDVVEIGPGVMVGPSASVPLFTTALPACSASTALVASETCASIGLEPTDSTPTAPIKTT